MSKHSYSYDSYALWTLMLFESLRQNLCYNNLINLLKKLGQFDCPTDAIEAFETLQGIIECTGTQITRFLLRILPTNRRGSKR